MDKHSFKVYKGTPQRFCLGPILWILVANGILQGFQGGDLIAYADDFALVSGARSRAILEAQVNTALSNFQNLCNDLNLEISEDKTVAIVFGKLNTKARSPTFKLGNTTIRTVETLKYLGIILDNKLNFIAHAKYIRERVSTFNNDLLRVAPKSWGINARVLKIWYLTVVERQMSYGAAVWAGSLGVHALRQLDSAQRVLLLRIARTYRKVSTAALRIITGITPISITLFREFQLGQLRLGKTINTHNKQFNMANTEINIGKYTYDPLEDNNYRITIGEGLTLGPVRPSELLIFTDGSRYLEGVGFAFCAYYNCNLIYQKKFKLQDENSIFQAELLAILEAVRWAGKEGCASVIVYSDSQAALKLLQQPYPANAIAYKIKDSISIRAEIEFKFIWIRGHIGHQGNELADKLANEAALDSTSRDIYRTKFPKSYVKNLTRTQSNVAWQNTWDTSDKGRHTNYYFPTVSNNLLIGDNRISMFFTGHGPFPSYLYKIGKLDSENCECAEDEGTPDHYMFNCPITQAYHLREPIFAHRALWAQRLLKNKLMCNRLRRIAEILIDLYR